MTLRIVGAGLGRTGTKSLQAALERLTGGRCYHMNQATQRPQDTAVWASALAGGAVDWRTFLDGYDAVVDWPAASFWRELAAAFPDAPVLLSRRASGERWWTSFSATILPQLHSEIPPGNPTWEARRALIRALVEHDVGPGWTERDGAIAGYEAHLAAVRAAIAPERLCEWQPGDGWTPLCRALGVPEPAEPFPHTNTTKEFNA